MLTPMAISPSTARIISRQGRRLLTPVGGDVAVDSIDQILIETARRGISRLSVSWQQEQMPYGSQLGAGAAVVVDVPGGARVVLSGNDRLIRRIGLLEPAMAVIGLGEVLEFLMAGGIHRFDLDILDMAVGVADVGAAIMAGQRPGEALPGEEAGDQRGIAAPDGVFHQPDGIGASQPVYAVATAPVLMSVHEQPAVGRRADAGFVDGRAVYAQLVIVEIADGVAVPGPGGRIGRILVVVAGAGAVVDGFVLDVRSRRVLPVPCTNSVRHPSAERLPLIIILVVHADCQS